MNKSKKTENCGENKQKKPPLGTVLFAVGALLLALALVFTVTWAVSEVNYRKKSPQILSELDSLLPEVKKGSPDDRVNTSHAMVDIDGESFIGIIENYIMIDNIYNCKLCYSGI